MNVPKPHAILFDLDGTLADTGPDLAAAINLVRAERGLEPVPYEKLRPVASAGAHGMIGAAFGMAPEDPEYPAIREKFIENYTASIAEQTVLFDGVPQLLAALDEQAIPWGIVTNKVADLINRLVPQLDLDHARCVITGDTTPFSKPHPEPLLEAARRLQIDPHCCWYVGDDPRDIEAGRAAGMRTVAAGWGYCGNTHPTTWGADILADSPLQIIELLLPT